MTFTQVAQSGTTFHLNDAMIWQVTKAKLPRLGSKRHYRHNFNKFYEEKRGHGSCIIHVDNVDQLCVPRALVLAKAWYHRNDGPEGSNIYLVTNC
jgi:hypothetical protein